LDLDTDKPSAEETAKKFGFEDDYYSGDLSWWQKTKPKIWSMFDEPYSSSTAKVQLYLSIYKSCHPGLPVFSWSNHTKTGKVYQMTTDYTNRPYIIPKCHKWYQTAVKYTNIFHSKALHKTPKLEFLVLK
jgi:hypothetical protein